MSTFTIVVTPKREHLFDVLAESQDYKGFAKSDLVEAGLSSLAYNLQHPKTGKDDKPSYPQIDDVEAWAKLYKGKMTEKEYRKIDRMFIQLLAFHNKRFKEGRWDED